MPLYVTNSQAKYLKTPILKKDLLALAQKNPQKLVHLFKLEHKARVKAEELSEIDDITELLLNRRGWKKYVLEKAYELAYENLSFTIFFIDLDRLKAVDDTFTNQHGTVYIQLFAEVLHNTLRTDDIKSHPQGDEFFVMLPNTNVKEAKELRKKIIKNFDIHVNSLPEDHFFYEVPKRCEVGASIGIAYKKWPAKVRKEILESNKEDMEKLLTQAVRETRIRANADSVKIKKRKKVVRDEARSKKRAALLFKYHKKPIEYIKSYFV
jgi:diguanylate cyclase (GGDEF)-like protein